MKYLIFTLLVLFNLQANAIPGDQYLDCNEAPVEVVTKIEHEKVSRWVQIVCTTRGHIIIPQDGYLWSYYGGFVPLAFFAQGSGKDGKLREPGHLAHFIKIRIKELDEEKSKEVAINASFNNQLEGEIPKVYAIQAIAYNGEKHTFFIQEFKQRLRGALRCHKPFECKGENDLIPFFIYNGKEK